MFDKFTDRARRVVVLSQDEAKNLGHNYIGTEHLLLGLIREGDGIAARALSAFDVDLPFARAQVEDVVGRGTASPSGQLPFDPRCKKAFDRAIRIAMDGTFHSELNNIVHINTEHLLLGLIRDWDTNDPAIKVLEAEYEVTCGLIKQELARLMSDETDKRSFEPAIVRGPAKTAGSTGLVDVSSSTGLADDNDVGRLENELSRLVSSWTATYEGDIVAISVSNDDSPAEFWVDPSDQRCGSYAEALAQVIQEVRRARRLVDLSKVLESARALHGTAPILANGVPVVNEVLRVMLEQVISRALAEAHTLGYHGFDEPEGASTAA